MNFVSYAQNYEDVTLFRALAHVVGGRYIDVGAGDPLTDSVTRAFYERGWRGINVEPVLEVHGRLVADRPDDVNLRIAVADREGMLLFHEVVGTGMSTLDAELATRYEREGRELRRYEVPVRTLDSVLDEHPLIDIHFLKVDVEGAERQALAGIDLKRHRPWVVLVEATRPNSTEPTHEEWESLLVDRGYAYVYFDGLNRWYVANEREAELRAPLSMPPNYFDFFIRHDELVARQRIASLEAELSAAVGDARAASSALAKALERSAKTADVAPVLQWLTRQLDNRDALQAAQAAQAAHDLHVREVAHAHRTNELSTMIDGLSAQVAALDAELVANRAAMTALEREIATGLARAEDELESARRAHEIELGQVRAVHQATLAALEADIESERARAVAAEAESAGLALRITTLEGDLVTERDARTRAETECADAMSRIEAIENDVARVRADAEHAAGLAHALAAATERLAVLEAQLEDARATAAAARTTAEYSKLEAERISAEVDAANRAAELARLEALQQRELAAQQTRRVEAMLASASWRVTAPLRAAWSIVLRSVNRTLRAALLVVRATPNGTRFAIAALRPFPALDRRMRRFAVAYPPAVARTSGAVAVPIPPTASCPVRVPAPPSAVQGPLPRGHRRVYYFVDHTVQCPVNTGMQRVTRGLARALLELGEQLVFVKWDRQRRQLVHVDEAELAHLSEWRGPVLSATELVRYPASGHPGEPLPVHDANEGSWLVVPEVTHINYHGVGTTIDVIMSAKRCNLRSAFVFYDAIPLRRPEMAGIAPLHEIYMQQLLLVDLVVPISAWSGSDLASFLVYHERARLTPTPRIAPLLLPGESHFSARVTEPSSPERRLILAVGTIEHRKNQHTLLRAFEAFAARNPDSGWELVLIGNVHHDIATEVSDARARVPSITIASNVPDDVLGNLYRECAFTVFASVEEGFGLPILESLWHGKPCICANFGAMSEVGTGGGCLQVDTRDADALAAAIERLALDATVREELAREACRRPLSTWADYGAKFSELMDEESDLLRRIGTIYYCIEHTVGFPYNTGIQRVVRGLARSLLELGLEVVPVKWRNDGGGRLELPSEEELCHFALWNGPAPQAWTRASIPDRFARADWLVAPELTVYPGGPDLVRMRDFVHDRGGRVASVFYDAIPWKMHELYAAHWGEQHARYMAALGRFDRVLAISRSSREDLASFLAALPTRTPALDERIRACVLPGEFLEAPRSRAIRQARNDVQILSVGSIEPRKNHLRLLRAFAVASRRSRVRLELTLAGGLHMPEPDAAEFHRLVAEVPGVRWEANPDDARLRALYAACDFTVYPSLEEGFGLPILESLWNARPCICRDRNAMAEVAEGGGCITVDTADESALAEAILGLAEDDARRLALARAATERPFRTWREYAREFAVTLAAERYVPRVAAPPPADEAAFRRAFVNLRPRPRLSVCITTYNRASWLALSLQNIARLLPQAHPDIEIVVCDNASTDGTPEVVQPYVSRPDFRYYRNPVNVGMLGNLQATAHHARGRHVWILGDDDLVRPGAIERVLRIVTERPDLALVYLNYAYTREDDARRVTSLDQFLDDSVPIAPPGPDIYGTVRDVATCSENFFTAIYCLVFRRDHALRAYSQNTDGRPFSTMLTCIPTTYHVLHGMMDEPACWVGEPQLVVNMNVSWLKYASLWILERLPEMFDVAEMRGADPEGIDRWRAHNVPGVVHYFGEILNDDPAGNAPYFSAARLVARFKHIEAFAREVPRLKRQYEAARARGASAASIPTETAFAAFPNA